MNMTATGKQMFGYWAGYLAEWVVEWVVDKRRRIARPRNVFLFLVVLVAFTSSFVDAQSTPAAPAASAGANYSLSIADIVPKVSAAVDAALNQLGGGALNAIGTTISAFFLIALMVWTGVKTMATGKGFGELIGEWVPIWISFAFVYAFLDRAAGNSIEALMGTIGTAIGGAPMNNLSSAIDVVSRPIFSAIAAVSESPLITKASFFEPTTWVPILGAALGSFITKIITIVLLTMGGVIGMGTVIMSFISVKLVLFMAPVMVPFIMFKPMSWVFDSWLRFLLGACMMKIVLAFMLTAAASILGAMTTLQAQLTAEAANAIASEQAVVDMLMHAMMMIFALLSTLLLTQVPGIATGLLSGSAGGTGFGGMKGLTQSAGSRVVNAPPHGAANKGIENVSGKLAEMKGRGDARAGRAQDMAYREGAAKQGYARGYQKNKPQGSPG